MAEVESVAASVGGIGVGVGSTLLIRRELDQTGETTVLRPSVLWGLGTGTAALVARHFLFNGRRDGIATETLEDYGEAALTAGTFSAFSPKGGGVALPTL